jgi:nitrogenase molybdenum-iron protein alpha/beta subunit
LASISADGYQSQQSNGHDQNMKIILNLTTKTDEGINLDENVIL